MRKLIAIILVLAAGFAGGYGYGRWYGPGSRQAAVKKAQGYHCPMHPHIKSDHPGECPICGMKLVPDDQAPSAAHQHGRLLYYHDPKQPAYRSDKPGINPETGNDLVPVYEQPSAGLVMIPADKQQWIGLKTGTAEITSFTDSVRVSGRVTVDESRVIRVQTRFEGWIDKVHVDYTGRLVKQGEPMLTLYSPELTASQQEYLLALRAQESLHHSMVPGVAAHNTSLAEAARARLSHHWGLSDETIAQLEKTGKPQRTTTVLAPATGFVLTREAYAGQMAKPEMALYTMADLSKVWIIADVAESDAASVAPGQYALVEPSYAAGRKFRARVTQILPQIDPMTRTLKVRLEADNPNFTLRPDLFVNVEFPVSHGARLTVPEDAVIDSGASQVVYLDLGQGRFEPRRVEILSGLQPGERIVISGAFLVDSESRMRSGAR